MLKRISKTDGFTLTGFTLVEIMVAVSLFAVVALIVSGAVITAQRISQKFRAVQLVTDNLNFALDSMALKMRASGAYSCIGPEIDDIRGYSSGDFLPPKPCPNGGNGVFFITASKAFIYQKKMLGNRGTIEYAETPDENFGSSDAIIATITRSDLDVKSLRFYVFRDYPTWPRVWITLRGETSVAGEKTQIGLQNTVSERN